jgi:two-component sensor histidine kinase
MFTKNENIHLQSEQVRIRTINLFCGVTTALASPYLIFLLFLGAYISAAVMAGIMFGFLFSIFLNRKGRIVSSRLLILASTNFAVLYFSSLFGYASGIHLYLFTSPLIVYLLYNFKQTRKIVFAFSSYVFTFVAIFLMDRLQIFQHHLESTVMTQVLYGANFCFALTLAFLLIVYFASNNAAYNQMLEKQNSFLQLHESALLEQIEERAVAEKRLKESLHEKDILLSEIHHRVKNNLALVSGLLELQGLHSADEKVQAVFAESCNRIKSLASIHESLYQTENLSFIRFDSYFESIFTEASKTYLTEAGHVELNASIDPIKLDLSQAIPCGLLVNEIISNAYKYAFKSAQKGQINVTAKEEEGCIKLMVRDNGCGLPPLHEIGSGSFGMTLITSFVQQLKGKLETSNENGAVFRISFPYKKISGHAN